MDREAIRRGAELLRSGELVAFPTETVYGLGANALDAEAVAKIFVAKGRPSDNPLIVHVSSRSMLAPLVREVPDGAEALIDRFWPGPLTLVFPRSARVPDAVTAGLATVAVRMPADKTALALIRAAGVPLAAPSANRSGNPSPTSATHVREDLPHVFVIDGGETTHGLESTVVALDGRPRILREGAISLEQLREVIPSIRLATKPRGEVVESPGQKYRHYAPRVPLTLYARTAIDALVRASKRGEAAVLCRERDRALLASRGAKNVVSLGADDEEIARRLYAELRRHTSGRILVLAMPRRGLARTIMDRLQRAATKIVE